MTFSAIIIQNETIVNIIETDSLDIDVGIPGAKLAMAIVNGNPVGGIGDKWDGYKYTKQVVPPSMKDYEHAAQSYLDQKAIERGYDSILTAVSYADEPSVTKFQQDGIELRVLRSSVWATAYAVLEQVNEGKMPTPTLEQFVDMLPAIGQHI